MTQKDPIATSAKAGFDFAKIFYKTLDERRHLLGNVYLEDSEVIWNGNFYVGKDAITKFYTSLPHSETNLLNVDAQPISAKFQEGKPTIIVTCAGDIRLKGLQNAGFSETFIVTAEGSTWKVLRDTFRFHEPSP